MRISTKVNLKSCWRMSNNLDERSGSSPRVAGGSSAQASALHWSPYSLAYSASLAQLNRRI